MTNVLPLLQPSTQPAPSAWRINLPYDRAATAPMSSSDRRSAIGMLAIGLAPLFLLMPPMVSMVLIAVLLSVGALGIRKPWPNGLRLTALMASMGLLFFYGFSSRAMSWQEMGLGALVLMLTFKMAELHTVRDGYSLCGLVLIGPFLGLLQPSSFAWSLACAVIATPASLALRVRLAEQETASAAPRPWPKQWRQALLWLAMSAPFSAAAFWLIPRLDHPLWGTEAKVGGTGMSDSMEPGDLSELFNNPDTAFRVTFQDKQPFGYDMYWRGTTLVTFDGRRWTRGPLLPETRRRLVAPAQADVVRYTMTLEPQRLPFVPALDRPYGLVPEQARLDQDGTTVSLERSDRVRRYTLSGAMSAKMGLTMTEAEREQALRLPEGFNPRTRAMAQQWRSEGLDDEAFVRKAQNYFKDHLTYTYTPPLLGRHTADELLFDTRLGFCEHFSSAFAVLMRSGGIPARVVTGYQGGGENEIGGYWQVRQFDAHAWNEVWLKGKGWVRVDPTASVTSQRPPTAAARQGLGLFGGGNDWVDWARQSWAGWVVGFDADRQRSVLKQLGLDRLPLWGTALVVGGAFVLAMGLQVWWLVRRTTARLPRTRMDRAYDRMVRRLKKSGATLDRASTPREVLAWVRRRVRTGDALAVAAYEARHYQKEGTGWTDEAIVRGLKALRFRRS